jgi:hypothetical protein
MKKHLEPVARKFVTMGFDVRTPQQKAEDERQKEAYRLWTLRDLASRYNREKIYEEIWSEPIQHVAKRYKISDVGLAKVCRKLNIHVQVVVIGPSRRLVNQSRGDLPFRNWSETGTSCSECFYDAGLLRI